MVKAVSPLGSTNDEQIRLATEAMASHRSAEKEEKEEQRRFQAAASRPEGPPAPSVVWVGVSLSELPALP